jgi:hypothetical protein
LFNPELLIALDDLRDFFNLPITVNNWITRGKFQWRGYRTPACPEYSPGSQHSKGNAIDCDIQGMSAQEARHTIIENKDDALLKRIMRLESGKNWLHFDLLSVKERIHLFKA